MCGCGRGLGGGAFQWPCAAHRGHPCVVTPCAAGGKTWGGDVSRCVTGAMPAPLRCACVLGWGSCPSVCMLGAGLHTCAPRPATQDRQWGDGRRTTEKRALDCARTGGHSVPAPVYIPRAHAPGPMASRTIGCAACDVSAGGLSGESTSPMAGLGASCWSSRRERLPHYLEGLHASILACERTGRRRRRCGGGGGLRRGGRARRRGLRGLCIPA